MTASSSAQPSRWHSLYIAGWACGLIAPLLWVVTTRQTLPSIFGARWERLYHISGVFSGRVTRWRCNYIEMRFEGSKTWEPFRTDLYSGIYPSGGRNRLDRMLDDSSASHGAVLRRRLAQYLVKKHRQLFPGSAAVEELRFVRVWFPTGSPALATPLGGWSYPPPRLAPPKERKVLSTHSFKKGRQQIPISRFTAPVGFGDAEMRVLLEKGVKWESLDLSGSQITEASMRLLAEKQPGLQYLSLKGTAYTDAWGNVLGKMSRLISVDLSQTKAGSSSANWLTGLKSLKTLRLEDTMVDAWLVGRLRGLRDLEVLSLGRTKITGESMLDLSPWPKLKELSLAGCPLKGGGLLRMRSGVALETLDLSGMPLTASDFRSLRRLAKLKALRLDGVQITEPDLVEIKALSSLETLSLRGGNATQAMIDSLKGHPSLKAVIASDGATTSFPLPNGAEKQLPEVRLPETPVKTVTTSPPPKAKP